MEFDNIRASGMSEDNASSIVGMEFEEVGMNRNSAEIRSSRGYSGSVLETEETKGESNPIVKFKMIMIGDVAAGKSDMMAKYFGKSPHDVFMSLTEGGMYQESRIIECCNKSVKLNCLDTTQSSQNPELFKSLIKP